MQRIPIVIKTWAGSEDHDFNYISRSIPSLLSSALPEHTDVLIFDDCSPNRKLRPFLEQVASDDPRVKLFFHDTNVGPNKGQERAVEYLLKHYDDAPFFVSVDDDIIYHSQWLKRLMVAKEEMNAVGVNGIFTALNIAYRTTYASVRTPSGRYELKWRQPSLNWLIPREVIETVGSFKDEGVAFDTVYFHLLRLHNFPQICLKPSYIQNIGVYGAYSQDTTTAADDFVGSGNGLPYPYRLLKNAALKTRRVITDTKAYMTKNKVRDLNPVRWGVDWLFDAKDEHGCDFAFFLYADSQRFGWDKPAFAKRVDQIKKIQKTSLFAIQAIAHEFYGGDDAVCCEWSFMPSLKDCTRYPYLARSAQPIELLRQCAAQLAQYHAAGVVHNKIRSENIFSRDFASEVHLAWFGSELYQGKKYSLEADELIALFATALDKRASQAVREQAVVSYLLPIAPELLEGEGATCRSDVFALGAVIAQYVSESPRTVRDMVALREQWASGRFVDAGIDQTIGGIVHKCCAYNPMDRFADARAVLAALESI